MLGFICNNGKISGKSVGKIDLKGVFTFFEVENSVAEAIQQSFKGVEFNGRAVRIELAGEREGGGGRERSGGYSGGGRRDGGSRERSGGGGFRDFSGKKREERSGGYSGGGAGRREGERRRRS